MLLFFRQNSFVQIILILLVTAILWLKTFISPVEMAPEQYLSPFYGLLQGALGTLPVLRNIITILLIIVEAVWLNIILANNKLNKANWLMPTLLFVMAMSWGAEQHTLTPIVIATLPILAAIRQLLASGSTTLEVDRNFNAAFFIGLAIMCYLPAFVFIVPFFLVFVTYKSYHWRDIIVAILGLTAPAFILFIYAFLTDKLDYFYILILHDISNAHFIFDTHSIPEMAANIFFIVILLWALMSQLLSFNDMTIQQRINAILFMLPLLATILMLPYNTIFTVNTQYAAIPFAFLASNLLATDRKHRWINEVTFDCLIASCLIVTCITF